MSEMWAIMEIWAIYAISATFPNSASWAILKLLVIIASLVFLDISDNMAILTFSAITIILAIGVNSTKLAFLTIFAFIAVLAISAYLATLTNLPFSAFLAILTNLASLSHFDHFSQSEHTGHFGHFGSLGHLNHFSNFDQIGFLAILATLAILAILINWFQKRDSISFLQELNRPTVGKNAPILGEDFAFQILQNMAQKKTSTLSHLFLRIPIFSRNSLKWWIRFFLEKKLFLHHRFYSQPSKFSNLWQKKTSWKGGRDFQEVKPFGAQSTRKLATFIHFEKKTHGFFKKKPNFFNETLGLNVLRKSATSVSRILELSAISAMSAMWAIMEIRVIYAISATFPILANWAILANLASLRNFGENCKLGVFGYLCQYGHFDIFGHFHHFGDWGQFDQTGLFDDIRLHSCFGHLSLFSHFDQFAFFGIFGHFDHFSQSEHTSHFGHFGSLGHLNHFSNFDQIGFLAILATLAILAILTNWFQKRDPISFLRELNRPTVGKNAPILGEDFAFQILQNMAQNKKTSTLSHLFLRIPIFSRNSLKWWIRFFLEKNSFFIIVFIPNLQSFPIFDKKVFMKRRKRFSWIKTIWCAIYPQTCHIYSFWEKNSWLF